MSGSPILESESPDAAVERLWQARLPGATAERRRLLDLPMPEAGELERAVLDAVSLHLRSLVALEEGDLSEARAGVTKALAAWLAVERAIDGVAPELAARAHAFHARLASRHQAAYGALARKGLSDLAQAAKLKTESIRAAAFAAEGDMRSAAVVLGEISAQWRRNVPIRLPGLRPIELAAARWLEASGSTIPARIMRDLALTISGRHVAYPDESPETWPSILRQEDWLRFAFAASRLPLAIESEKEQP